MNLDVEVPNCVLGAWNESAGIHVWQVYVGFICGFCLFTPRALGGIYIKNNYIMIIKNNELMKYTRERNLFALAVLCFVLLLTCTQVQC